MMSCNPPQKLAYIVTPAERKTKPNGLMTANAGQPYPWSGGDTPWMMYDSSRGPRMCSDCNKTVLNKEMGIKRAECFTKLDCGYTKRNDGRLKDVARSMLTELDAPPYEGDVGYMGNVYSDKLKEYYPRYYDGYSNINTGQIEYYQDSVLAGPYPSRTGNWAIRSDEDQYLYKNPMGVVEFQAKRYPITAHRPEYLCAQNFLKDSMNHREDLMSKQAYNFTKNSFNARYGPMYVKDKPIGETKKPVISLAKEVVEENEMPVPNDEVPPTQEAQEEKEVEAIAEARRRTLRTLRARKLKR